MFFSVVYLINVVTEVSVFNISPTLYILFESNLTFSDILQQSEQHITPMFKSPWISTKVTHYLQDTSFSLTNPSMLWSLSTCQTCCTHTQSQLPWICVLSLSLAPTSILSWTEHSLWWPPPSGIPELHNVSSSFVLFF